MTPGRIVLTIVGALLALTGLALLLSGGGLLWLHAQRDADGYLTTSSFDLATDGYAITSDDALVLEADPGTDRIPFLDRLDLRFEVERADGEVFVGIAPAADVAAYLDGVPHDEVERLGPGDDSRLRSVTGAEQPAPPEDLVVWTAQERGPAPLTLDWEPEAGAWAMVLMDAEGGAGVAATVRGGVRTGALLPAGALLGFVGLILLLAGTAMVVAGLAGSRTPTTPVPPALPPTGAPTPGAPAATGAAAPGPYPLHLRGTLEPGLSRWRPLVKWLLLIPHIIVLLVLWIAFFLVTVVAFFAILFTGRYPRALFDFNVGVLRWSWRVSYYGYGALGTDRYPPFTLDEDPHYPAQLQVDYPPQLSRGLVLVKWWLLALPHYLIVAVLVGSALTWTITTEAGEVWRLSLGNGLVGILVLVAAVTLLFTATYPPRLFDLVLGCQRWAYRVIAYAALMTDAYPPFRLDQGGEEPPVLPGPPPVPPGPPRAAPPREPVHH